MKRNKAREGPEIMTLQDVAEYLNCHPVTVHRLLAHGKLPAFRLGPSDALTMGYLTCIEFMKQMEKASDQRAAGLVSLQAFKKAHQGSLKPRLLS